MIGSRMTGYVILLPRTMALLNRMFHVELNRIRYDGRPPGHGVGKNVPICVFPSMAGNTLT